MDMDTKTMLNRLNISLNRLNISTKDVVYSLKEFDLENNKTSNDIKNYLTAVNSSNGVSHQKLKPSTFQAMESFSQLMKGQNNP